MDLRSDLCSSRILGGTPDILHHLLVAEFVDLVAKYLEYGSPAIVLVPLHVAQLVIKYSHDAALLICCLQLFS